jgi:hypothetical protein
MALCKLKGSQSIKRVLPFARLREKVARSAG